VLLICHLAAKMTAAQNELVDRKIVFLSTRHGAGQRGFLRLKIRSFRLSSFFVRLKEPSPLTLKHRVLQTMKIEVLYRIFCLNLL